MTAPVWDMLYTMPERKVLLDVQPEDIEDVTSRYVHLFAEERNSDVVKRVHIRPKGYAAAKNMPFYLISLIEHNTRREARKEEIENGIERLVKAIKQISGTENATVQQLMEQYGLSEEDALTKIKLYWDKNG